MELTSSKTGQDKTELFTEEPVFRIIRNSYRKTFPGSTLPSLTSLRVRTDMLTLKVYR